MCYRYQNDTSVNNSSTKNRNKRVSKNSEKKISGVTQKNTEGEKKMCSQKGNSLIQINYNITARLLYNMLKKHGCITFQINIAKTIRYIK